MYEKTVQLSDISLTSKPWMEARSLVHEELYNCLTLPWHQIPGWKPGPEVIKLFPCSTQLSMKFFLLINIKMPTIVGILTFMSRKNSILSLSELEKCWIYWYFHTYEHLKFHAQVSWAWKKFYNLGARSLLLGREYNSLTVSRHKNPCFQTDLWCNEDWISV